MNYFQLYEKRRLITPGSVWKNSRCNQTIVISSVDISKGKIYGTWTPDFGSPLTLSGLDTISWLLRFYHLVEK